MNKNELMDVILKQIKQPLWENWYINEKIGSGSYSVVYRLTAQRMNRVDTAALKIEPIIPDKSAGNDEEKRRRSLEEKRGLAVNESTIMYNLRTCPNIVGYQEEDIRELIIDGKLEGYYFLIRMEMLSCVSNLLKNGQFKLTEENVLRLAKDIGKGLKAAHDMGIIHRDLKPGNFFVDDKGVYKLGDFNISKQAESLREFAGTNSYLAPEVFSAKTDSGESYTCQADVYSFGICLYQFMNGLYLPFEEKLPVKEAVEKRINGEPLPAPSNASPQFAAVILKACAYSRDQRYGSIAEMLRDLEAIGKAPAAVQPVQPIQPQQAPFGQAPVFTPQAEESPKKSGGAATAIAIIAALAVIAVLIFVCVKLFTGGDDEKKPENAVQTSSATTESKTPITDISLNKDTITINIFEDIDIRDVDCPDVIKMSALEEMFGFTYDSTLYSSSSEPVVTVNADAEEELTVLASEGLFVSCYKDKNKYFLTVDAEDLVDTDTTCEVILRGETTGVEKKLTVNVDNTGPFRVDVKRVSSNPEVIEFRDGDSFTIHDTGEAEISWVYNNEVKFTKKVVITE